MEFELTDFKVAVQHFNHYGTGIHPWYNGHIGKKVTLTKSRQRYTNLDLYVYHRYWTLFIYSYNKLY